MIALSMEIPEPSEPPVDERERRRAAANERRLRRYRILLPILLALAFAAWAFTTNYIPSRSMEPTLRPGDHILTMRSWLAYPGGRPPARGDIVVFLVPLPDDGRPPSTEPEQRLAAGSLRHVKGDILIKRVAALPGETIQIQESRIWINGREIPRTAIGPVASEGYAGPTPYAYDRPVKLANDEVFVLGDNPAVSDDSRFWGPLNRDRILGRYVCVLFHEGAKGPNRKFDEKPDSEGGGS
jgi:signal peptidase I